MEIPVSDFSPDQWFFLSTLEVCGNPIPLSVFKILVPLDSKIFQDFLDRCETTGWIKKTEDKLISLILPVPKEIRNDLQILTTPDRISTLLDRIRIKGLEKQLDKRVIIKLLADSGKTVEASEMEIEYAYDILAGAEQNMAHRALGQAVGRLHQHIVSGKKGSEELFLRSVLEFSNLSFALGRGMHMLLSYLKTAVKLAESYGDDRFNALGILHLGRLESYFGNDSVAIKLLIRGHKKVEMLGDLDILKAATELLGFHHFIQGQLDRSVIHFARAEQNYIQNEDRLLFFPMSLWYLGIVLFLTGQIPRALGLLQNYWQLTEEKGWSGVSVIARSLLGLFLAVTQKHRDARYHLNAAIKVSQATNNAFSDFIARTGLAIQLFHENKAIESFKMLQTAFQNEKMATSAPMICSLFLPELLCAFHQQGFEPVVPGLDYEKHLQRYAKDRTQFSTLFTGITLRLRAEKRLHGKEASSLVLGDIDAGREHYQRFGADYLLKDIMITHARLHLRDGNLKEAKSIARDIWQKAYIMGLEKESLPVDIRDLLDESKMRFDSVESFQHFMKRYFKLLHELDNSEDIDNLLYNSVGQLLKLLGAERGALFWAEPGKTKPSLSFLTGCNLTRREAESEEFKPRLSLINRAFTENRMLVEQPQGARKKVGHGKPRGVFLIPIRFKTEVQVVYYYENGFIENMFDRFLSSYMLTVVNHFSIYVRHLLIGLRQIEEINRLHLIKSSDFERSEDNTIVTEDKNMLRVVALSEKAAISEATLLVTGETGTGKELLVQRIHTMSNRSSGPLIVVDATTIPEHLVESELFGHEKGAFTGADRRKQGRIELAHKGTLFIDEIGELPLPVQSKLLRVLETRTLYRVGGTQSLTSNFRLVAATNRNLTEEVAAGRFRQDLYYRLNVISFVLPPLRDRGNDILLLANHFLKQLCHQYGHSQMQFTHRDIEKISSYPWPGNIRELKNTIERSVVLSNDNTPALDLPDSIRGADAEILSDLPNMEEMQRRYIQVVLEKTDGRIGGPKGAAKILGMKRSTLNTRMYKLGLRKVKK
jgi:formate hydrogenlyase transcriptional activator